MDRAEYADVVALATAGDEQAFATLQTQHRHELHVHCYRMLGSYDDADDLVQETFLRAWRARAAFDGLALYRAWLYRIATNACLDALRLRQRRPETLLSYADLPWLQPYPDSRLDVAGDRDSRGHSTEEAVVSRETIELAFLAALQVLPPTQRVTLIARDVLGWSAAETASLLAVSEAAANSALQRARSRLRQAMPQQRDEWSAEPTSEARDLLRRFMAASERSDVAQLVALLSEDVRITMPPHGLCFEGIGPVRLLFERAFTISEFGDWRLVATSANRQPAAANYNRSPGDTVFRAFNLDVLRIAGGRIVEITTFDADRFPEFGLAPAL